MKIRSQNSPSRGFTLVEMLVVITIISILAALLIPVVQTALTAAQKTRNGVEISNLMMALERYKSENNGLYPPSLGEAKTHASGPTYRTIYDNNKHRNTLLYRYLTTAYPRISNNDITYMFRDVADHLDQSSALVFWLSQTSNDARFPFTNQTNFRKYFDFQEKKLSQLANMDLVNTPDPLSNPQLNYTGPAMIFYGYHAPYSGDAYYAYLEAKHYPFYVSSTLDAAQGEGAGNTDAVARSGDQLTPSSNPPTLLLAGERLRPYLKSTVIDNNPRNLNNYVNPETYQLICAGLGGHFQASRNWMRRYPCGSVGSKYDNSAIDFTEFADDRDNQANFTEGKALEDVQP